MQKFIIKQRVITYQYVVVEAKNKAEAMSHIPFLGDEIVTDSGYFVNLEAKPFNHGDLVTCSKFHFIVVAKRNLYNSIRKFLHKNNFKPWFQVINTEKIRPVHPGNPDYSKKATK